MYPTRIALLCLLCTCVPALLGAQTATELIEKVVDAMGGPGALHRLEDVEYTYTRGNNNSLERYRFDGEVSYGRSRDTSGRVHEEYHNGRTTTVLIDGQMTLDPEALARATFRRKTNYYWLTMMHKLRDPGARHTYVGNDTLDGTAYQVVDMTFDDGVGQAKDRYRLFIHPETHLVDRFLYTVAAYDRMTPTLKEVTYETFADDVRLPVATRSRAALDWDGTPDPAATWTETTYSRFRFHNGFTAETIRQ